MPDVKRLASVATSSMIGKTSFQSFLTPYRNNADKILPLDIHIHSPDRDTQIWRIATTLCPFFAEDDDDSSLDLVEESLASGKAVPSTFRIQPLCGGLSNELFMVHQRNQPRGVLVRVHPTPHQESGISVVDREVENQLVAWLSSQGMAPTLYGRFGNGRVEEFYANVQPLTCVEMHLYTVGIATCMANFHNLKVPTRILPKPARSGWSQVDVLNQWLQAVMNHQEHLSVSPEKDEESSSSSSSSSSAEFVQSLQREWTWLREQLSTYTASNPAQVRALEFIRSVVLCHMDCQSLNILKDASSGGELKLIDFEYAGWNPRAADIANTFCEHTDMNNLKAKYDTEYPSIETQNLFLMTYIAKTEPRLLDDLDSDEKEDFLATVRHEIGRFTLLSCLGWSIWSILKASEASTIDFDYWAYARHRMDGYRYFRSQYF